MGSQKGPRSKLADVLADIKNSRTEDEYDYNNHDLAPTPAKRRAAVNYVALSGHTPRQSRSSNSNSRLATQSNPVESQKSSTNTPKNKNRTCILKLFERNVDLAPFSSNDADKSALYPICRAWIHGHNPSSAAQDKSPVRLTNSDDKLSETLTLTQQEPAGEGLNEVNTLPAPKTKSEVIKEFNLGSEGHDVDIRIPQSVREFSKPDNVGEMIDKSMDSLGHQECLELNKLRWRKVRNEWKEARRIHEQRYENSFKILQDMFLTSQRGV